MRGPGLVNLARVLKAGGQILAGARDQPHEQRRKHSAICGHVGEFRHARSQVPRPRRDFAPGSGVGLKVFDQANGIGQGNSAFEQEPDRGCGMGQARFMERRHPPANGVAQVRQADDHDHRHTQQTEESREDPKICDERHGALCHGRQGASFTQAGQGPEPCGNEDSAPREVEHQGNEKRGEKHQRRIHHQSLQPRPKIVLALIVVGQEGERAGQVVAPGAGQEQAPRPAACLWPGRPPAFPIPTAACPGACRRTTGATRLRAGCRRAAWPQAVG